MEWTKTSDNRKFNKYRPKKVSPREERIVLRKIRKLMEEFVSFAIKRLRFFSRVGNKVGNETVKKLIFTWRISQ